MPKFATLLLFSLAIGPAAAADPPAELFLAGGALRTCSDLAPAACRTPPGVAPARGPARYRVDDGGVARALDERLWQGRQGAPDRAALLALLSSARRDADWDRDALEQRFDSFRGQGQPWRRLLDDERAALLSALELAHPPEQPRPREATRLADSRDAAGVEVLRAFVAAAKERAGGAAPRIAVVTASAQDPFEPVDFYLSAFRELGAEVEWWPVDAALNAAVFEHRRCDWLDAMRRERLRQSGRDRPYPDLGALQWRACLDPERTRTLPSRVQGLFFAGGDQWRHRQAFFGPDEKPNAWLVSLREAHAAGRLVVGGTSAGTAVQAGRAMVSNGTAAEALRTGARAMPPLEPGCERAGRCAQGLPEDTVTYWPAGGLGLLPDWTLDTHFSDRGRELRLLRLMHDAGVDWGAGVDETSALRFVRDGDGWRVQALGREGGWLFQRIPPSGDGAIAARVHYLAPGAWVRVDARGVAAPRDRTEQLAGDGPDRGDESRDALEGGALRNAVVALANGQRDEVALPAGTGVATLARTRDTHVWQAPSGRPGALNLELRYAPKKSSP